MQQNTGNTRTQRWTRPRAGSINPKILVRLKYKVRGDQENKIDVDIASEPISALNVALPSVSSSSKWSLSKKITVESN